MAATTSDTNPPKSLYKALYTAILPNDHENSQTSEGVKLTSMVSGHSPGTWSHSTGLPKFMLMHPYRDTIVPCSNRRCVAVH